MPEAFDPNDPYDAASDLFRKGVLDLVIEAMGQESFQHLPNADQSAAIIGGVLTGMIQAVFSYVEPCSHDDMMKVIRDNLDFARSQAESVEISETH